ncbi:MAG: hypothetical protein ACOX9E_14745 [Lentisphaeria bacterium]
MAALLLDQADRADQADGSGGPVAGARHDAIICDNLPQSADKKNTSCAICGKKGGYVAPKNLHLGLIPLIVKTPAGKVLAGIVGLSLSHGDAM